MARHIVISTTTTYNETIREGYVREDLTEKVIFKNKTKQNRREVRD